MQPGSSKVVSPSAASPAMAKDMAIRWSDRVRILVPCSGRPPWMIMPSSVGIASAPMAFRFSVSVGFFYLQFLSVFDDGGTFREGCHHGNHGDLIDQGGNQFPVDLGAVEIG